MMNAQINAIANKLSNDDLAALLQLMAPRLIVAFKTTEGVIVEEVQTVCINGASVQLNADSFIKAHGE